MTMTYVENDRTYYYLGVPELQKSQIYAIFSQNRNASKSYSFISKNTSLDCTYHFIIVLLLIVFHYQKQHTMQWTLAGFEDTP